MRSKMWIGRNVGKVTGFAGIVAFLIVTLLTISGCGLRIGEENSFLNTEGVSVGCLNGINEKMDLYLKGRLTVNQINQVSNCIKAALTTFKNRVRGRTKGEFTPSELRKFIQDLFLQDRVMNDTLLAQLMRLKQVIIGGPVDKLTVEDIDRFIIFVNVLSKEALFFQPYIQVLNAPNHEKELFDVSHLDTTIEQQFAGSLSRVSGFIRQFSNPYLLSDLKVLIRELDFFFDHEYNISNLDEKINLLGVLKQFVVGGSDAAIQPNEWEGFLLGYSYLISAGVNYSLLKKQSAFISSQGMRYISMILNDLLEFFSIAIKSRPQNLISESDFLKVAYRLKKMKIIPEQFQDKAIRNLLFIIFGKVFNVRKDRYGTIELTFEQLKKMRKTIEPWMGLQSFLDHISSEKSFQESVRGSKKMISFFPDQESFSKGQSILNQILLLKPLYKVGKKIHLSRELYVEGKSKNVPDYKNLTVYNFYYLISTMMRSGYEIHYPRSVGMTQEELKNFFLDFNIIAENIGWFQKTEGRALAAGEAEFIAANILAPSAKGFGKWNVTEYLTSNEITEYMAYAVSIGLSLIELETAIIEKCGSDRHVEQSAGALHIDNKHDINCVRAHLIPALAKHIDNMPDLQTVLSKMNEEQKSGLAEALIDIAFEREEEYQEAAYLTQDHLKNIVMALYFVETTINRYDLNGDFILRNDEIWAAYPQFGGYLSHILIHLICQSSDSWAASMYAYVIKHHQLPTGDTLEWYNRGWAGIQLIIHTSLRGFNIDWWDLYLDHEKLTQVFSTLVKGFMIKKRKTVEDKCYIKSMEIFDEATAFP